MRGKEEAGYKIYPPYPGTDYLKEPGFFFLIFSYFLITHQF